MTVVHVNPELHHVVRKMKSNGRTALSHAALTPEEKAAVTKEFSKESVMLISGTQSAWM